MATATPSQRAASHTTSPANNASTAPKTREWGRSGEPGSAFRGLSRGRGSVDRGRGVRGVRGGRGGGPRGGKALEQISDNSSPKLDQAPPKFEVQATPQATPSVAAVPAPAEKPSSGPSNRNHQAKPSRRSSRTIPSLVIDPSSPTTESTSNTVAAPASSRPRNSRRRSQQYNRSPSSAKQTLSVERTASNLRLPQKSRTGPPSPISSGIASKDLPPHLSASPEITSFDMRHNIDALVERVRAVAMADNRPTTPGSHIDWAGDDDDSLPDLDDWGVTTGTSAGDKDESISPILEDSLKRLPEPISKTDLIPSPIEETVKSTIAGSTNADLPSSQGKGREIRQPNPSKYSKQEKPDKPKARNEKNNSRRAARPPRNLNLDATPKTRLPEAAENTEISSPTPKGNLPNPLDAEIINSAPQNGSAKGTAISADPPKIPLHPSLPPKPAANVDSISISNTQARAMPMRVPLSTKLSAPVESLDTTLETPHAPEEEGLRESIHAPSTVELVSHETPIVANQNPQEADPPVKEDKVASDADSELGLAASIHAPKVNLPKSNSAPSHISSYVAPNGPPSFNPTHNRAQTVGRPPAYQQTLSGGFDPRLSRSGANTPHRSPASHGNYHARTHSSPPSGAMGAAHRVSQSRPVITGDAISRLARTIGGTSMAPRSAVVSKE